jgi:hypothetical protein
MVTQLLQAYPLQHTLRDKEKLRASLCVLERCDTVLFAFSSDDVDWLVA